MNNKNTNIIAAVILFFLLVICLIGVNTNSLTFDEKAHIPAGYTYLKYQDYRINPEHPPLIKSASSLPLLFKNINFPEDSENWQQKQEAPKWWVQFDLGDELIYQSNNNPRDIIIWSRIPMVLMLLVLGLFLFKWAREIGGNKTALMTLILFSFSPTLIAHGQLVTTDVGAALGAVIAIYFWLKFLKKPDVKNVILASIFFGLGLLFKFSLALLIPFFIIITVVYSILKHPNNKIKSLLKYIGLSLAIGVIAVCAVIWPIYAIHNYNYPIENQIRDTQTDLAPNPTPFLRDIVYDMTEINGVRHLAQYFRGLLMATQRTGFGNTVYFLGDISAEGWWYYFPVIYLLKEPLALHVLTLLIPLLLIIFAIKRKKRIKYLLRSIPRYVSNNFTIFSCLVFIAIYWAAAIVGNLNIGARHLIPTLPFLYLIISDLLRRILIKINSEKIKKQLVIVFSGCFLWYVISSISAFPNYIPYYNELAGGSKIGYIHAVDSNYDWGQDFYKLLYFVDNNNIDKIHLDYFGGENPEYWLMDKYQKLDPRKIRQDSQQRLINIDNQEVIQGWVAVSLNELMGGIANPVHGFEEEQTGHYLWLTNYPMVDRIGKTIFVYYID